MNLEYLCTVPFEHKQDNMDGSYTLWSGLYDLFYSVTRNLYLNRLVPGSLNRGI